MAPHWVMTHCHKECVTLSPYLVMTHCHEECVTLSSYWVMTHCHEECVTLSPCPVMTHCHEECVTLSPCLVMTHCHEECVTLSICTSLLANISCLTHSSDRSHYKSLSVCLHCKSHLHWTLDFLAPLPGGATDHLAVSVTLLSV